MKLFNESIFVRFGKYVTTWRKHRQMIKELYALSDKELRDIGINRADIEELIFRDSDRKI